MEKKVGHESGVLHVTGKAVYIDDMNAPSNTLTGYVYTSNIAKGKLKHFNIEKAQQIEGVYAILSFKDLSAEKKVGPIVHDEPVLVNESIEFIGQAMFLIAAINYEIALKAAEAIIIELEEEDPVITLDEAIEMDLKLNQTMVTQRGNIQRGFESAQHILRGSVECGAQEHWYLETQISLAIPGEHNEIKVFSSTQHPSETQALIAEVLGVGKHDVVVETRRLGGAFGGKETQANLVAIWASLLAQKTQHPVKIRFSRDDDQKMTGKRHPFNTTYEIGFDDEGVINAYRVRFKANAGYSSDLTLAILARARTHAENAYFIPNIHIESIAYKTNLPSNTAFRGFGGPQGIYAIEDAIERVAHFLKKDPAEIRFKNFYQKEKNNITPYGELVEYNHLHAIWEKILFSSDYKQRRGEVERFNAENEFRKKGISLTPVKFGISFTTSFLNQAGALVNIYTDGTVLVNHGGIEMGQGLHTKIGQIAAVELGVDIEKIKVNATTTSTVPNTSATAASSGTDLNGMAVKNAIDKLKKRMFVFLKRKWGEMEYSQLCFDDNVVCNTNNPQNRISFTELVNEMYLERISLSAQGFYKTPNLNFNREKQQGRLFHYFVFGMAVSEVELDILTGNFKILRTDILHDSGKSINKNIDIGQIEGAFMQGVGWCTLEEIKWDEKGNMLNHSPDTYKIPGIRNIPQIFNVQLLENAPNPYAIKQSKAVGEPPFVHSLSVFFALQYAVASVFEHQYYPALSMPATNEKVILTIERLRYK